MKILLVIPPSPDKRKIIRNIDCSHEAKANYLWQPNDFMIITSRLKPEDDVALIDGTADAFTEDEFLKKVKNLKGDMLFFALSNVCWKSDFDYFVRVKEFFKDIPVFVIGDIFLEKDYRSFILTKCDGIVFQPYLLNLEVMLKAKEMIVKKMPGVCTEIDQEFFGGNKRTNYVESNFPRHEVFLKKGYRFPFAKHFRFSTLTTMWGCPFSCSYCTDSKVSPVVRHYQDVVKELEYLSKLGIRELFFADKVFGYPYDNVYPLLDAMSRNFSFSWSCYFHPQLYREELLQKMRDAGCHTIIIGIDSANLPSLEEYNRKVQQKNIDELLTKANQLNMSICADFILGLAHETEDDIVKTINYAMELPIDFASFNIAAPLPGSIIREHAYQKGQLTFGEEGFDTQGHKDILETEFVSGSRLRELRNKAVRRFYMRPSYLLRRLKRTSSLEHFLLQSLEMLALFKKAN